MASIKLTELRPVGSELFHDSEGFINELDDQEMSAFLTGGDYSSHGGWSSGFTNSWSNSWTGGFNTNGTITGGYIGY